MPMRHRFGPPVPPRVAAVHHRALVPSLLAGVPDHSPLLLDDGIHPTKRPSQMLAKAWPTLSPLRLD
jgi:hypothetical protein